jgi:HSP20 family protein
MTNAFLSNPFGFARAMNQEMDRLFSGNQADVTSYAQRGTTAGQDSRSLDVSRAQRGGMSQWSPQVEVRHNGNKLTVCADLPGLSAKDIDIQVDDGVLTISGERSQTSEDKQEGYYRSERSYGSFSRSIALPEGVNEDQIQAKFDNGVLEVTVPVSEQRQRGRRVEIQSGG